MATPKKKASAPKSGKRKRTASEEIEFKKKVGQLRDQIERHSYDELGAAVGWLKTVGVTEQKIHDAVSKIYKSA